MRGTILATGLRRAAANRPGAVRSGFAPERELTAVLARGSEAERPPRTVPGRFPGLRLGA